MTMRHLALGLAVVVTIAVAPGCIGFGPKDNRLFVSEWKSKKASWLEYEKGWTYDGEHWEHTREVDEKTPRDKSIFAD